MADSEGVPEFGVKCIFLGRVVKYYENDENVLFLEDYSQAFENN
ncbi:hypothetical protein HRbin34_00336 [bacterium HR34]|nr:hypothetical protein HRbin34_00336 [bacterium HR34]